MTCKRDHTDPDVTPEFLCRECHPELVKTPEQNAAELKQLRSLAQSEAAERQRKEAILRTQARLATLDQKHHGDIGGVDAKVAKGLRVKLEKLEQGEVVVRRKRRKK